MIDWQWAAFACVACAAIGFAYGVIAARDRLHTHFIRALHRAFPGEPGKRADVLQKLINVEKGYE